MRTRKRAKGTAAVTSAGGFIAFTPIVAPRGRVVHATSMRAPTRTACGKKFGGRGWRIALDELDCHDCNLAVGLDARPRKRRRKVP